MSREYVNQQDQTKVYYQITQQIFARDGQGVTFAILPQGQSKPIYLAAEALFHHDDLLMRLSPEDIRTVAYHFYQLQYRKEREQISKLVSAPIIFYRTDLQ